MNKNILFQPYPQRERSIKQSFIHSLGEGLFLYFFLYFFQPFGMSDWHSPHKAIQMAGFALITSVATFTNRHLFSALFPAFYKEENWVIWKEIFSILLLLSIITLGITLYGSFLFGWQITFHNLVQMFVSVLVIGIFPTVFWVFSDYIRQLKKYATPIDVHHHAVAMPSEVVKNIRLVAENDKDSIELLPSELLYIESSDNYSTIVFFRKNQLQKLMLRSSLSRLEGQLPTESILRCHRSYIVNLERVERVSGNAQGYKLHLNANELVIPVARKYSSIIEKLR